jgi:hypothetical protein
MRKIKGMNKHQKAVYRVGERRTSTEEIAEMLVLSTSPDVEERLIAAEYMCPCHVRKRIPAVWEAIFRMLEDDDKRVRQQAWHTLEDGGKPSDPAAFDFLIGVLRRETDPKVKRFAEETMRKIGLAEREKQEDALLWLAAKPAMRERGKCDFCGATSVLVDRDLQTMIPTGQIHRVAWICDVCARSA